MRVRQFSTGILAATACIAMAGVTTTATAAAPQPLSAKAPTAYQKVLIRNVNSDKCASIPAGTTTPKTQVVQWTCGPFNPDDPANPYNPAKMWYLVPFADGSYAFQNVKTGQCLTTTGSSPAKVWQYTCVSGTNQRWTYYITGSKRIWSHSSGDCLAVPGARTDDGVGLINYTCGDGDEQKWKISYLD
ncbi:RICIN domain-containing protein [Kribbella sp. NPDC051587]|uniref:RICIN domain-containing protein n=1 Tax=Kribbella sp. NPDC051587 TaxID=3364119 RepID=UPI0037916556